MNNHPSFDKDEQMIHEAFSKIEVDTHSLKRKMKESNIQKTRRPARLSFAMMAMVALLVVSGTVYAAGGLEELIARFNPHFGEVAQAPSQPIYTQDQGIRLEVYGSKAFDNSILFYYSLQDISGLDRLNESTCVGWFDVIGAIDDSSISSSTRFLYFDSYTHTIYFEAILTTSHPFSSELTIETNGIFDLSSTDPSALIPVYIVGEDEETVPMKVSPPTITGHWRITIPTDNAIDQILTLENVVAPGVEVDRLAISPIGIHVVGSRTRSGDEDFQWPSESTWPLVDVELSSGQIVKHSSGAGGIGPGFGFDFFIFPDYPIDTSQVVAVIINDSRIPIR